MEATATLFDLTADDYFGLVGLFFLPTVVLAIVFAVNASVKSMSLAGFSFESPPSKSTLAFVTFLSVGIVAGLITVWLTLKLNVDNPNLDEIPFAHDKNEVHADLTVDLQKADFELRLSAYDGDSNLRVFLNGHTIFDTIFHCPLKHQCLPAAMVPTDFYHEKFLTDLEEVRQIGPYTAHCDKLTNNCPLLSDPRQLELLVTLVPPLNKKRIDVRSGTYDEVEIEDLLVPGFNSLLFIQENGKYGECESHWHLRISSDERVLFEHEVSIQRHDESHLRGTYQVCSRDYVFFTLNDAYEYANR